MHQDKVLHTGAYFIMGILAWRVFNDYFNNQRTVVIASICFCSLYGISDEWHQSMVPGRDADIWDWIADTLGATIAVTSILLIKEKLNRNKQAN